MNDILSWLEDYYSNLCDGDWEHGVGIAISTIDNPGWAVKINLKDTTLEGVPFARVEIEHDTQHWMHCWVRDNTFEGAGGSHDLKNILGVFKAWRNSVSTSFE